PVGLCIKPRETLFGRARQWLREHLEDGGVKLDVFGDTISEALPENRDLHDVDIMIVTPDIKESLDEFLDLSPDHVKAIRDREAGVRAAAGLPSPSTGVGTFSGLQTVINGNADVFHTGRPHNNHGPPVALFNPILGLLAHRLSHVDKDDPAIRPDHHESKWAHEFIHASLECYDSETTRIIAIRRFIESLHPEVHWKEPINKVEPDVLLGALTHFPSGVGGIKNEAGLRGDASMQACLWYAKIVTENKAAIRKNSNCPAIVFGLMGDVVEIGITVYTDGAYSDLVFSSGRMRLGYHQNAQVLRVARAFKAVKLALAQLDLFYEQLNDVPRVSVQHLFPSPLPVPSWDGEMPSLTFTHRMSCSGEPFITPTSPVDRQIGMYLGTMLKTNPSASPDAAEERIEVVIKFTSEYNQAAHRLVAQAGFAPALHACVPVCGDVQMVVMDRVHGKMAWCAERKQELLPRTVYDDVKSAIKLLHDNNLVFGDLRSPNVMCVPKSEPELEGRMGAMLVDFDWAGEAGRTRYPAVFNDGLPDFWATGAERCGLMYPEHDLHLLEKFEALCHSE
ncbi:hypothetical protein OH76DRAFT_1346295, partial [Lentinus brumalis]